MTSLPPQHRNLCLLSKHLRRLQHHRLLSSFESSGEGFLVLSTFTPRPLTITILPHLKSHRGKLLSGIHRPGIPVYAASFIRRHEIVLETQLLASPRKFRLILIHELFHFVWARLGNTLRADFTALISNELAHHARGELGESSHAAKSGSLKNYICESFCDTAAWIYSGIESSSDFTLAQRWQSKRRRWFQANASRMNLCPDSPGTTPKTLR